LFIVFFLLVYLTAATLFYGE